MHLWPRRAANPSLLHTLYNTGMRERAGSRAVRRARASVVVLIQPQLLFRQQMRSFSSTLHVPDKCLLRTWHARKWREWDDNREDPLDLSLFCFAKLRFDTDKIKRRYFRETGNFVTVCQSSATQIPIDIYELFPRDSSYLAISVALCTRWRESSLDFFIPEHKCDSSFAFFFQRMLINDNGNV